MDDPKFVYGALAALGSLCLWVVRSVIRQNSQIETLRRETVSTYATIKALEKLDEGQREMSALINQLIGEFRASKRG